MVKPTAHSYQIDPDTHISYQRFDQDTRSQTCVLLIHSLAMDHRFWNRVAPLLSERTNVVVVDVRGHGTSSVTKGPYSIRLFSQDLRMLVDGLGYKKVIVAGASMGGCIALQFATDHPEVTVGLGLIDTTAWYGPSAHKDWSDRADKARIQGLSSLVDFQKTRWFSEKFRRDNKEIVDECIRIFLQNDVEGYAATCLAMGAFDGRNFMTGIRVPTEIIVGEEDYAAPVAMAQALNDGIQNSSLTIIPASRHLTPLENPQIIFSKIEKLIEAARSRKD